MSQVATTVSCTEIQEAVGENAQQPVNQRQHLGQIIGTDAVPATEY
jgi:hypothetical protein